MKPKLLPVLEQCIESGIQIGLNRAYKHNESPSHDVIADHIGREIMNQIYEWFDFDEETFE